jgi:hypothetical protein
MSYRLYPLSLAIAFVGLMHLNLSLANDAQRSGLTPPHRLQMQQIAAARSQLSSALKKEDAQAIEQAEAAMRQALGLWVGVPEVAEKFRPASLSTPASTAQDMQTLMRRMAQLGSGSEAARKNQMELRHAAYLAIGLLALAQAYDAVSAQDAAIYKKQAALELDWLMAKQAAEGFFPYPANPVAAPHLQNKAARVAKNQPEKIRDGYIHVDLDSTQFDTGCASYALAYGFLVLKEPKYWMAARKAGDWALSFPLSANWNYNAFSVWQLAKLYEVSSEDKYRQRAMQIAKLGILPSQLPTGRWSDPHNARSVYHWIMVRSLVTLLRVLPKDSADAIRVRERTQLAIESEVQMIAQLGGSPSESAAVALTEALEYFGPYPAWQDALARVSAHSPYALGILVRYQASLAKQQPPVRRP